MKKVKYHLICDKCKELFWSESFSIPQQCEKCKATNVITTEDLKAIDRAEDCRIRERD